MTRSKSEFKVHSAFRESDTFVVTGRVLDSPLSVGDVFRHVYRLEPDRAPGEPFRNFKVVEPRDVNLRIDKILVYRKSLPAVDPAFGARLFLSGTGTELVEQDDVLGV